MRKTMRRGVKPRTADQKLPSRCHLRRRNSLFGYLCLVIYTQICYGDCSDRSDLYAYDVPLEKIDPTLAQNRFLAGAKANLVQLSIPKAGKEETDGVDIDTFAPTVTIEVGLEKLAGLIQNEAETQARAQYENCGIQPKVHTCVTFIVPNQRQHLGGTCIVHIRQWHCWGILGDGVTFEDDYRLWALMSIQQRHGGFNIDTSHNFTPDGNRAFNLFRLSIAPLSLVVDKIVIDTMRSSIPTMEPIPISSKLPKTEAKDGGALLHELTVTQVFFAPSGSSQKLVIVLSLNRAIGVEEACALRHGALSVLFKLLNSYNHAQTTYQVVQGDSVSKIARDVYGDEHYFPFIVEANHLERWRIDHINTGANLALTPMYAIIEAPGHLINYGETLWGLAQVNLGAGDKYPDIKRTNGTHFSRPSHIFPLERINLTPMSSESK